MSDVGESVLECDRRHDIDWLRVAAFSILIFYHTGMLFVTWDWHIKDPQASQLFEPVMLFVNQWRLPLLFFISGLGTSFSLRRRTAPGFLRERSTRLLLPLVVGILFVVPPQVFVERQLQGQALSFLEFYPHFFSGIYPEGNFSWHHLWFLPYLFVFSVILIPFALLSKSSLEAFRRHMSRPIPVLLLFLPVAMSEIALRPHWPSKHNLLGDWANFCSYFFIFLMGFVISTDKNIWRSIVRMRWFALSGGVALFSSMNLFFLGREGPFEATEVAVYRFVRAANMWCWVLACLGFASVHLNRPSRWIGYANAAVYPFYILHQMFIILWAHQLLDWSAHPMMKLLVVTALTFCSCFVLYEALIRRVSFLRPCFGLKTGSL